MNELQRIITFYIELYRSQLLETTTETMTFLNFVRNKTAIRLNSWYFMNAQKLYYKKK